MEFIIKITLPLAFLLNQIKEEVEKLNLQNKDVVGILKIIALVFFLTLVIMGIVISNIRIEKEQNDDIKQTKITLYYGRKKN